MKVRGSETVAPPAPCMDLLTTVESTLRDKSVLRTACLNHHEQSVTDILEVWTLTGIVERLPVGNHDLVADAIVKLCLPI